MHASNFEGIHQLNTKINASERAEYVIVHCAFGMYNNVILTISGKDEDRQIKNSPIILNVCGCSYGTVTRVVLR